MQIPKPLLLVQENPISWFEEEPGNPHFCVSPRPHQRTLIHLEIHCTYSCPRCAHSPRTYRATQSCCRSVSVGLNPKVQLISFLTLNRSFSQLPLPSVTVISKVNVSWDLLSPFPSFIHLSSLLLTLLPSSKVTPLLCFPNAQDKLTPSLLYAPKAGHRHPVVCW